jgi:hypothetical protein
MTRKANYEPLVKTQQARGEATREKVLAALQTMEREIDEHGLYPENNGKVTLTEVARRAGVSAITLRNQHHHQTRDIVQDWLAKLKRRAPTTKLKARKAARDKITWYEDALKKVNFEALKWRVELAALTQENEKLRNQVVTLKAPADAKVVGIKSRKTTNDKN